MVSPVAHPALAEHLFPEAVEVPVGALTELKGVRAGAEADDGDAPVIGIHKVLHVLVGPVAEPKGYDNEVSRVHGLGVGDTLLVVGIDLALVIHREENGAVESVVIGEDAPKHGQTFLGAIFFVTTDKNDVLALTRAVLALVVDREMMIGLN